MESEILQIVASVGGVGGVFGVIILQMYRKDRKASEAKIREDRVFMEDRLTNIIKLDQETRENNTKALTELITLLRSLNGKLSR